MKMMKIPYHWNEAAYLQQNLDVAKAVKKGVLNSGWHHYLISGKKEKRLPSFYSFKDFIKKGTLSINYVLATWSGTRREGNDEYHEDRLLYLRDHIKSLQFFEHLCCK